MKNVKRGLPNSQSVRTMVVPIKNLQIPITDPGAGLAAWASAVIGGLPIGNVLILGAVCNLQLSSASAGISATFTANFSLGTTATADATLAGTEVNLLPSTAIAAATAKVSPLTRGVTVADNLMDCTSKTTNKTIMPITLNIILPDTSISANSILVANGALWLSYTILGDY